jgi:hypothetical protein
LGLEAAAAFGSCLPNCADALASASWVQQEQLFVDVSPTVLVLLHKPVGSSSSSSFLFMFPNCADAPAQASWV